MALLAEQVPEDHRETVVLPVVEADLFGPGDEHVLLLARLRQAGEVALYVGEEHRHAGARKAFGDALQRHGLAGAGSPGDQPMPVAVFQQQVFRLGADPQENPVVEKHVGHGGVLGFGRGRKLYRPPNVAATPLAG